MTDGDWEVTNEVGIIVATWVGDDDHIETFEFELAGAKALRDMLDIAIWEWERMSG